MTEDPYGRFTCFSWIPNPHLYPSYMIKAETKSYVAPALVFGLSCGDNWMHWIWHFSSAPCFNMWDKRGDVSETDSSEMFSTDRDRWKQGMITSDITYSRTSIKPISATWDFSCVKRSVFLWYPVNPLSQWCNPGDQHTCSAVKHWRCKLMSQLIFMRIHGIEWAQ